MWGQVVWQTASMSNHIGYWGKPFRDACEGTDGWRRKVRTSIRGTVPCTQQATIPCHCACHLDCHCTTAQYRVHACSVVPIAPLITALSFVSALLPNLK